MEILTGEILAVGFSYKMWVAGDFSWPMTFDVSNDKDLSISPPTFDN